MKNWFQAFAFKCNLYSYTADARNDARAAEATAAVGLYELNPVDS